MARKTVGYVELEWTCKRCGTKNPGKQNVCGNCGGAMEAADQFELPEEQKLITDEQQVAAVGKGVDIHCPYCGARNPAGTAACVQCGGDLKEGAAREAGKVLGAHTTAPVPDIPCPFCAAQIKANSQRCPNCGGDLLQRAEKPTAAAPTPKKMPLWVILALAAVGILCLAAVIGLIVLSGKTSDVTGRVQSVSWQRTISILAERPVQKQAWEDSLPAAAEEVSCRDEYRRTSDFPELKSTEVCGTPYTVDTGSGVGEVVQDCTYRVYDSYCSYTVLDWQVVDQVIAQGSDLQPAWPALSLAAGQQAGDQQEQYLVTFSADGQTYNYSVSDASTFAQFVPGSQWTLKINAFGTLTSVSP